MVGLRGRNSCHASIRPFQGEPHFSPEMVSPQYTSVFSGYRSFLFKTYSRRYRRGEVSLYCLVFEASTRSFPCNIGVHGLPHGLQTLAGRLQLIMRPNVLKSFNIPLKAIFSFILSLYHIIETPIPSQEALQLLTSPVRRHRHDSQIDPAGYAYLSASVFSNYQLT